MDLLVRPSHNHQYEVCYVQAEREILLSKFDALSQAIHYAQALAKSYRKNVRVAVECVADHYVGFGAPDSTPEVFVTSHVDADTHARYRYIEGPFSDLREAKRAAYKISGKSVREI